MHACCVILWYTFADCVGALFLFFILVMRLFAALLAAAAAAASIIGGAVGVGGGERQEVGFSFLFSAPVKKKRNGGKASLHFSRILRIKMVNRLLLQRRVWLSAHRACREGKDRQEGERSNQKLV